MNIGSYMTNTLGAQLVMKTNVFFALSGVCHSILISLKEKKTIQPYEITMLKKMFIHEFNFDWTLDNNLDRFISHTLTLLSLQMNERGIKKSLNDSDFCYIVCEGGFFNSIAQLLEAKLGNCNAAQFLFIFFKEKIKLHA